MGSIQADLTIYVCIFLFILFGGVWISHPPSADSSNLSLHPIITEGDESKILKTGKKGESQVGENMIPNEPGKKEKEVFVELENNGLIDTSRTVRPKKNINFGGKGKNVNNNNNKNENKICVHEEVKGATSDLCYEIKSNNTNPCFAYGGDFHCIPRVFIPGYAKAGTSSMFNYLKQHPNIVAKDKEPVFFNLPPKRVTIRNLLAYAEPYTDISDEAGPCSEGADTCLALDGTPSYLYFRPESFSHLQNWVPHSRHVVLLREPVERSYSHWVMHVGMGKGREKEWDKYMEDEIQYYENCLSSDMEMAKSEGLDVCDYLYKSNCVFNERPNATVFTSGLYAHHLKNAFKFFSRDQFIFGFIEELETPDTAKDLMNRVTEFLNLPSFDYTQAVTKVYNAADNRWSEDNREGEKYVPKSKIPKEHEEFAIRLRKLYEPHNNCLKKLLNIELPW